MRVKRQIKKVTSGNDFGVDDNSRQPGFAGCRSMDVERPAGRRDVCRVVVHFSSATQNSPDYFLNWTAFSCV